MPSNLEIKARISSIDSAEKTAKSIGAKFSEILFQTDTYFNVHKGRLKLRELKNKHAELIYYERAELQSRRLSKYDVYKSTHPRSLKFVLGRAFGIRSIVKKKRILFLHGESRIHLDRVENLGNFIEFEVPIHHSEKDAKKRLDFLIRRFKLNSKDFFKPSYADLMGKDVHKKKSLKKDVLSR